MKERLIFYAYHEIFQHILLTDYIKTGDIMPINDKNKNVPQTPQNIILENRETLKITGVLDVESFNEDLIITQTNLGRLLIRGSGLKVTKLNLENFELSIGGYINTLEYANKKSRKKLFNIIVK